MAAVLELTPAGLYCTAGDFYVDPVRPVPRAVVTHAHADHARRGHDAYLCSARGEDVLRRRVGAGAIESIAYGKRRRIGRATVSLHPAGHILGSAQVRVEVDGEVWVVTGDYKTEPDPTCTPFELVACDTLITECTFGLPIYRWPPAAAVFGEINAWWRANQEAGRTSILYGYSLGKAQRLLAGVDPDIGPIHTHGAVEKLTAAYREGGIDLPPTTYVEDGREPDGGWARALVIAPPGADGTTWIRRFGAASRALASGWMLVRGRRRQRSLDRGFVLSDHVDWPSLMDVIDASGCSRVLATHGPAAEVAQYLRESRGLEADELALDRGDMERAEAEADDAGAEGAPGEDD